jgi:hypothetical protein
MRSVCFLSPSHRLPSTLLTLLLLLSLVMSLLPQPLIAQPPAVAATPPPVAQASVATAAPDAVAATINCNDPPPGERARVLAEDEVFLSYRYKEDNESLRTRLVDNDGMNLVDKLYTSYSSNEALTKVRQIAVTAADLNGDDKYEMISAVRDKHDRIGVVSSASVSHEWYADGDHYKSEDIKWVDIAAGDLDRSGAGDEVVVAFADTYSDIRVVLLDGNSAGYIRHSANQNFGVWTDSSSSNGRGSVSYVAVAAGDLNGDGFDDEIAVAFRDGNRDLQLLILRRNADGTVTLLWSRAWTNHDRGEVAKSDEGWENWRPIDVTTGDVNGDLRDEVVLAFRSGTPNKGVAQMLVVELEGESKGATPAQDRFTMRDGVYAKTPARRRRLPRGDGRLRSRRRPGRRRAGRDRAGLHHARLECRRQRHALAAASGDLRVCAQGVAGVAGVPGRSRARRRLSPAASRRVERQSHQSARLRASRERRSRRERGNR